MNKKLLFATLLASSTFLLSACNSGASTPAAPSNSPTYTSTAESYHSLSSSDQSYDVDEFNLTNRTTQTFIIDGLDNIKSDYLQPGQTITVELNTTSFNHAIKLHLHSTDDLSSFNLGAIICKGNHDNECGWTTVNQKLDAVLGGTHRTITGSDIQNLEHSATDRGVIGITDLHSNDVLGLFANNIHFSDDVNFWGKHYNGEIIITNAPMLPNGDYMPTCTSVSFDGKILQGSCKNNNGTWVGTSLNYANCSSANGDYVRNINGSLTCTQYELPPGNYTQTCKDIIYAGNYLSARCANKNGELVNSGLNNANLCANVINDNANLICNKYK